MKKAAKGGALQAVTANLLASGAVVFRRRDGGWSPAIGEAQVVLDAEEAAALLAAANRDAQRNLVVEPYLIDVADGGDGIAAKVLREAIRTHGPTITENAGAPAREMAC